MTANRNRITVCLRGLLDRVRQYARKHKPKMNGSVGYHDTPFDPRAYADAYRPHTRASTPQFDLEGRRCVVRVVSVYDGDTLQFVMPLDDGKMWRFSARLTGIDTCEMRDPDRMLRQRAVAARDRLVELVTGIARWSFDGSRETSNRWHASSERSAKDIERLLEEDVHLIHVTCGKMDKYGRVLVTAKTPEGADLAQTLLTEGHARPYIL